MIAWTPMSFSFILSGLLLFSSTIAFGQMIDKASCDHDGKVRLVYSTGAPHLVSPEPGQVGCDHVAIAPDKHVVAWSVLVDNCCTSYPIAGMVVVLRDGHKAVIRSAQSVWDWRFVQDGKQLAILSGPVHGGPTEATLYSTRDGKQSAAWNGEGKAPEWAQGWEEQFQP